MWERYGADFVCDEEGHWKYLHEQVCPDFQGNYDDVNWGLEAYQMATDPSHRNSAAPPPDADSADHPDGVNGPVVPTVKSRKGLLQTPAQQDPGT